MPLKKNVSLWLGIAIPIIMILFVAASIYLPPMLPRIFKPPQYNFLYSMGSGDAYWVKDGKLALISANLDKEPKVIIGVKNLSPEESIQKEKFFIYDVQHNKNTALSFKEAQALNLDSNIRSADGFSVIKSRGQDFLFWGGGDCCSLYIKSNRLTKRLDIPTRPLDYSYDFHFIGWIK